MVNKKVTLGSAIIFASLALTIPSTKMNAAPSAKYVGGVAFGASAVALVTYFLVRTPLEKSRFEKEKLFNGGMTEKAKQLLYFFLDEIVGWPYEDGEVKGKAKSNGEVKLVYDPEQEQAGLCGYVQRYGSKALEAFDFLFNMGVKIVVLGLVLDRFGQWNLTYTQAKDIKTNYLAG